MPVTVVQYMYARERGVIVKQKESLRKAWSPNNKKDFDTVSAGSSSKALWLCSEGHEFSKHVFYVNKNGLTCPYCAGKLPILGVTDLATTHPGLVREWSSENAVGASAVTQRTSKTVQWECQEHHHRWTERVDKRAQQGYGCPYCSGQRVLVGFNDLESQFPDLAEEWSATNDARPSEVTYGSSSRAVEWVCRNNSDHTWKATPNTRTNVGSGCPVCSNKKVIPGINDISTTAPEIARTWSTRNNRGVTEVTEGSDYAAVWDCPVCGNTWECKVYLRKTRECPSCGGRTLVEGLNDLLTKAPGVASEWLDTNEGSPATIRYNSADRVGWKCRVNPTHLWYARVTDRVQGSGCPKCSNSVSVAEEELFQYVQSILPGTEVIHGDRDAIGKQLDIYVPSLGIAIEYNGLYWHREESKSIPVQDKMDLCHDKGIDLYVVWEDDWRDRNAVIRGWVKSILGADDRTKVNARSCQVVKVSTEDSDMFLNETHIQGPAHGSIRVGLVNCDTIVALAVFKRYGDRLSLERYATSANVRGGFTKIVRWVDRNIAYSTMTTFADKCVSKGKLYAKTGWTEVDQLAPDYSYVVGSVRRHKFNYRVSRFRDSPTLLYREGATERELAQMNKLHRIYDAGKIKYERKRIND